MLRSVTNKILVILFVAAINPLASYATEINLTQEDLSFLSAIKTQVLTYVSEQKAVTIAAKDCLANNRCDAVFLVKQNNTPYKMSFDSSEELASSLRKLHTKFRILGALKNKQQYKNTRSQGIGFISPLPGYNSIRYWPDTAYGRNEYNTIMNIIRNDETSKEEFMKSLGLNDVYSREYMAASQSLEEIAADTYEIQMTQLLGAMPFLNEVLFAEIGRSETQLSNERMIEKLDTFIKNLDRTRKIVNDIEADNVVDTFMFPAIVNQVLQKKPEFQTSFEKLSAYTLTKKTLINSFIDKFTNVTTWAILGCFAGTILAPKAAPLIMGVCGAFGLGTMTIMATRTAIQMYKINPLVKTGLVDASNLSYLQSVLTHQLIMGFLFASGSVPNIIKLAKGATTVKEPVIYYSQVVRDYAGRKQASNEAWRSHVNQHISESRRELTALVTRFGKMNAKDISVRIPTSAIYQSNHIIPKIGVSLGLFEIITFSDSVRIQQSLYI